MSSEGGVVIHVFGRWVLDDLSFVLAAHVHLDMNTISKLLHFRYAHGLRSDGHGLLVEVERLSDLNGRRPWLGLGQGVLHVVLANGRVVIVLDSKLVVGVLNGFLPFHTAKDL